MKRLCSIVLILALAAVLLHLTPAAAQDQHVQIIFMHHSTGANLIAQGGVREAFTALGYEFWDHGYNGDGLVDPAGNWLGINWDVPGDNTDQDGWYAVFSQPVTDPPSNTFSHMLQADVIIFKSCFPTSTTSISLVGLLSRSTMFPASLAACVPVFIAIPTSD